MNFPLSEFSHMFYKADRFDKASKSSAGVIASRWAGACGFWCLLFIVIVVYVF